MGVLTKLQRMLQRPDEAEPRVYECRQCNARFSLRYYQCPECGSFSVERTEWMVD